MIAREPQDLGLTALGGQAEVLGFARNHAQINADVGADNDETRPIAAFIDTRLAP
ncbi:hypothetical protein D3C72_2481250 [compost metagenome]